MLIMLLGKISGKITTNHFSFKAQIEVKKFEYLKVAHKSYGDVLCQLIEIEKTKDESVCKCSIIGYKDEDKVKHIRIPFDSDSEVHLADDEFIKKIILFKDPEKGAYLGKLDGKDIDLRVDLSTVLTKHVAILAKSGAGKSYTVGVFLEEIMSRKVPLLIIDPHGEYGAMKDPNDDEAERLKKYGLAPKTFKNIREYGDSKINPELRPLKLDDNLTTPELVQLLPGKPSATQMGLLYNALKHIKKINFANILLELEREENNAKWTLVNSIDYLKNLELFSEAHVSFNEMVSTGVTSIINLKGIPPDVQEIIVYKLLKDLFEARKQNKIPPFFTVLEEAHNWCPERSFGETKCSKIIRTIASEGRKFGMGICVVSQRPARIDKSVVSQCTTQILLKITNPNDLKAVSNSVEGITSESEEEIKNLQIGTALVTGITDMPLFVNIRPRMTKHGGRAVNIIAEEDDLLEKIEDYKGQELLPLIKPSVSVQDLKVMNPKSTVKTILIPAYLFICKEKDSDFSILVEMTNGEIIVDTENFATKRLPKLNELSIEEIKVLKFSYTKKSFKEEEAIKKAGLDAGKTISDLVKKELLTKNKDEYSLNEKYIFSQLSKNACSAKVEQENVPFDEKKDKVIRLDSMKAILSNFTQVVNQQECFVVKYEITKGKREKKAATPSTTIQFTPEVTPQSQVTIQPTTIQTNSEKK